jgi:hypothetical protein
MSLKTIIENSEYIYSVRKSIEQIILFLGMILLIPVGLVSLPLLGLLKVCKKIRELLK